MWTWTCEGQYIDEEFVGSLGYIIERNKVGCRCRAMSKSGLEFGGEVQLRVYFIFYLCLICKWKDSNGLCWLHGCGKAGLSDIGVMGHVHIEI